jgi:hypothetical protein
MRVSLAPSHRQVACTAQASAAPLLNAGGACVILGQHSDDDYPAAPIAPCADTLFGPHSACLADRDGPLFICDWGHHRLLIWTRTPAEDNTPADCLIGQPDFSCDGRNAKGAITAATLNVPTGVAATEGVVAVADAWNHRVLVWHEYPTPRNRGADVVLGQSDFASGLANRGTGTARADTLNWCYGVAIIAGRLFVADTGNRRLLVWNKIASARGAILVADAGNNRIMVWQAMPQFNGEPCDFALGQGGVGGLDHNRAAYYPTAAALNMPYGLAVQQERLIADTANSRLLGFDLRALSMGAEATRLAGRKEVSDKGDNRWQPATRDSLCWPYSVAGCGATLVIADSGNNRVLLWQAAP